MSSWWGRAAPAASVATLVRTLRPDTHDLVDVDRECWSEHGHVTVVQSMLAATDLGPWLAERLRALRVAPPPPLADSLHRAEVDAAAHELLLREEVRAVVGVAMRAGIDIILIKGSARLVAPPTPLIRARRVRDCDVLVRQADVSALAAMLRRIGYHPVGSGAPAGHWHAHPMRHRGLSVEIHHAVDAGEPSETVWQRTRSSVRRSVLDGMEVLMPSPSEMLWQAFRHRLASPATWYAFRSWADVASLLPLVSPEERSDLRRRFAGMPASEQERLAPLIRAVQEFTGDPIADDLAVPRASPVPLAPALVWSARLGTWSPDTPWVESARLAPYRLYGHSSDALDVRPSAARRVLDAVTDAAFRQTMRAYAS